MLAALVGPASHMLMCCDLCGAFLSRIRLLMRMGVAHDLKHQRMLAGSWAQCICL